MRILEERHPGESWLLWQLGNLTTLPVEWVRSVGVGLGYTLNGKWSTRPRVVAYDGRLYKYLGLDALFYNSVLFVRLVWPLGVFVQVRWSGSTGKRAYVQLGIGWKLNARFGALFRIQSDGSAAIGAWSRVPGENASEPGWEWGPK